MGHLDQFIKKTFADETPRLTRGALEWRPPPEIPLSHIHPDGSFALVGDGDRLRTLAAPWSEARAHKEILVELKMPGDHLDLSSIERTLLRRQARQVQRLEDEKNPWSGHQAIWCVAPHVPRDLTQSWPLERIAPGCYRVGLTWFPFLWIAANELPLADELVPFLVARSGSCLVEFIRWVAERRTVHWVLGMIQTLPMAMSIRDELLRYFAPPDDPEMREREQHMIRVLLERQPAVRREVRDEGRIEEARSALRRVLSRRKFELSAADEARIEGCSDLTTLERWHDQAIEAQGICEVLS